ncbi:hypothetical protein NDU88_005233 [Pleurodeles waltl]|uniref:Uncharacterized protein n=1 Tax=Pleurodeles waltl TaxID=8319 RepID=A0AAV7TA82_PLEWA|nr:hypothetical protein NDU88_005233 [Pleurodeles waltl]
MWSCEKLPKDTWNGRPRLQASGKPHVVGRNRTERGAVQVQTFLFGTPNPKAGPMQAASEGTVQPVL